VLPVENDVTDIRRTFPGYLARHGEDCLQIFMMLTKTFIDEAHFSGST
jgi:hypothetical protein